jgi:hypothetical protein
LSPIVIKQNGEGGIRTPNNSRLKFYSTTTYDITDSYLDRYCDRKATEYPDIALIVKAWPNIPDHIKQLVVIEAKAALNKATGAPVRSLEAEVKI